MKKLLSILLISGIAGGAFAQDKKFQIGLVTGTTVNWMKINSGEIEKAKNGIDFIIGIGGNYMFNENVGIASGLQFDLGSSSVNYGSGISGSIPSGNVFYGYSDTDILTYKDNAIKDVNDTMFTAFEVTQRKFKSKYVTLPLFLKFQTNLIGKFRYYGKFGARMSFLTGVRMDDTGYNAFYNTTTDEFWRDPAATSTILKENMRPEGGLFTKKGLSFTKIGIGFYGGAEWNFTGNTFLYSEIGFNYGVTPYVYNKSGHLVNKVDDGTGVFTNDNLDVKSNPQHLIEIKLGLLF